MTRPRTSGPASPEGPERLTSRPAGGRDAEDRLAGLMRASAPPEGLGQVARARVWARLRGAERSWLPAVGLRGSMGLRWSVIATVLLASAGVVAGVSARRWWPAASRAVTPAEAPARKNKPKARAKRVGLADEPRTEDAPAASESAVPSAPAAPSVTALAAPAAARAPDSRVADVAPHRRASTTLAREPKARPADEIAPPPLAPPSLPAAAAPPAPAAPSALAVESPAPAAPSALAVESPLLAEVLTRLRQQQDPGGALAALDAYDARFPRGTLRREADGARVDALLLLGRDDEALAVLRGLTLQPRRRDQELRVIRGELSAPTSCAAAVVDFDRVLSESSAPALAERALQGRATCLARLGHEAAATRDLREYLRRFPDGRFAAEARRVLEQNSL